MTRPCSDLDLDLGLDLEWDLEVDLELDNRYDTIRRHRCMVMGGTRLDAISLVMYEN